MRDWTVPLSDVRLSESEVAAVADVLRSGWLSQGPRVAAFEAAFAEVQGGLHAAAVSSGTAALHLICAGLGLGPGDEVVLPSLTFAATAGAVVQTGATPVFADIAGTAAPWLSADAARAAIGPRTAAIMTVAYGGHAGELMALHELAQRRGLALIEDAAHAAGARVASTDPGSDAPVGVGTVGIAGAFSFFANKSLPLGEGGMVLSADRQLIDRIRRLRSHGLSATTWQRHQLPAGEYELIEPGFNYRLDEPRAALGLALLPRLAGDNARRARLADRYAEGLSQLGAVTPVLDREPGADSAWYIYPVVLDGELDRRRVRDRLAGAGVQTSIHYPALHASAAFASPRNPRLPATDRYAARTMTLPLFPHMTAPQQAHVLAALADAVAG